MNDLVTRFSSMKLLARARLAQSDPALYGQMRAAHDAERQRLVAGISRSTSMVERQAYRAQLHEFAQGTASRTTIDGEGRVFAFAGSETPRWSIQCRAQSKDTLVVDIHDDIGGGMFEPGVTSAQIVNQLRESKANLIRVNINSRGGDVEQGIAIYNRLLEHPARVETYVDGLAASIASVIAMAGDERIMYASSRMMVHDPWAFTVGKADELRKKAGVLDKIRDQLVDIYASRTRRSPDQVRQLMADETWMNAHEAVQQGFADRVVEHRR